MTPLYHPRPERWPQVSLRGMLVVTALVGLLTPWAIGQVREWNRREFERFVIQEEREQAKRTSEMKLRRLQASQAAWAADPRTAVGK